MSKKKMKLEAIDKLLVTTEPVQTLAFLAKIPIENKNMTSSDKLQYLALVNFLKNIALI